MHASDAKYIYIFIYIYIEREREGETKVDALFAYLVTLVWVIGIKHDNRKLEQVYHEQSAKLGYHSK